MKFKKSVCVLMLLGFGGQTYATEGLYAVSTIGSAKTEFVDTSNNDLSYKLGMGYQIDRQWYFEAGIQKWASDSMASELPITLEQLQDTSLKLDTTALYATFLGKAAGPAGELFYRIGLLKTDIKGQQVLAGNQVCELGSTTAIALNDEQNYSFCQFDEGGVAGVIGLGFDYFISHKMMVRTELEYIKGQNNLSMSGAYVGLRYNF
ncbi:outer membrane beta-barrel protein [Paraglaciecola sp. 25GB23A]|uniref:outer membrane beta-barrel protein n=1 Tax=Paraglaciecola sp. 25GB23A TaxID=3156068 RepID=UPI0032AFC382